MVRTMESPSFVTADASRSRLELANGAGALASALDTADTIEARDSIELMLSHQLAAAHVASMKLAVELNRRLGYLADARGDEAERTNLQATRLAGALARTMGAYAQGLGALKSLRTGGKQEVRVVHVQQSVQVSEGGQAVVAGTMRGGEARGGLVSK